MIARHGLAALVVVLLTLAGVEATVRLFALAPPLQREHQEFVRGDRLPFLRKPWSHQTGRNATGEFDFDYRHNSLGLRDRDHSARRPAGVFRIVGLGDSFTYGVGVPFAETYLSRLEGLLNSRPGAHPKVEVLNLAMPRYFPELERRMLEVVGLGFQPDLVLVGFVPNDIYDTLLGVDAVSVDRSGYLTTREAALLGRWAIPLYLHCHSCRIVLAAYLSRKVEKSYPSSFESFRDGGTYEPEWLKIEAEYNRMYRLADSIRARLVLLHIPQQGPWDERHAYPAVRLSRWASSRPVGVLSVLSALRSAASPELLYYPRDGHLTAADHGVIAKELYQFLLAKRLMP